MVKKSNCTFLEVPSSTCSINDLHEESIWEKRDYGIRWRSHWAKQSCEQTFMAYLGERIQTQMSRCTNHLQFGPLGAIYTALNGVEERMRDVSKIEDCPISSSDDLNCDKSEGKFVEKGLSSTHEASFLGKIARWLEVYAFLMEG